METILVEDSEVAGTLQHIDGCSEGIVYLGNGCRICSLSLRKILSAEVDLVEEISGGAGGEDGGRWSESEVGFDEVVIRSTTCHPKIEHCS